MRGCALGLVGVCLIAGTTASVSAPGPGGVQTLTGTIVGQIVVPEYTLLQGVGQATVVGNVVLNRGSAIDSVEITGWTDTTWNRSAGVLIQGNYALVRNCYIHDGPSHGVQVIGGYRSVSIIGNRIERVGEAKMSGSPAYPMASWRGISLESGSNSAFVSGNQIVDSWEAGIFEHESPGVVIRGNWVIRPNRGLVDQWNPGSGNGIESLSDNTVIDSNFVESGLVAGHYAGRHGIYVGGDSSVVVNNTIQGMARSGIMAQGEADGRRIAQNMITDVGGWSSTDAGIRVFVYQGNDQAVETVITGNKISLVAGGIAVKTGNGALADYTVVTGNLLSGLRLELSGEHDVAVGNI